MGDVLQGKAFGRQLCREIHDRDFRLRFGAAEIGGAARARKGVPGVGGMTPVVTRFESGVILFLRHPGPDW
ncbi:MAG TPA: hypothetical protein PKD99_11615 [Sphingopyxis sp.]|nr:hypothetical protein [Sphingopyxis sp.]HMP45746.1 hypothetical protein [Sphingopyxis sp.]